MTDTSLDFLSELPDFLAHCILSFLPINDVIKTSVLSKRWRYMWRSAHTLDFSEAYHDTINYVNRSLILHESTRIRKFSISIMYENCDAAHVDTWISFAVGRCAEEINLHFFDGTWWYGNPSLDDIQSYELPPYLLSSQSLAKLALHVCRLKCTSSFRLSSLKSLYLQQVFLTGGDLLTLISSCPLLENLGLAFCNRSDGLVIRHDGKLLSLAIEDLYYRVDDISPKGPPISVYAPKIVSFELKGNRPHTEYTLLNISSVVNASINFELSIEVFGISYMANARDLDKVKKLLESLSHVKKIHLCSYCIQVLSISELQQLATPHLNSTSLELKTAMQMWEIPGIVHLLKSFSFLEQLTMKLGKKLLLGNWEEAAQEGRNIDERLHWKSMGACFSLYLKHLKRVNIYGFMGGGSFNSEIEAGPKGVNRFLGYHHRELNLVNILLKNSKLLEKVRILMTEKYSFTGSSEKLQIISKLKGKIMAFPKASPNAEVCFMEG